MFVDSVCCSRGHFTGSEGAFSALGRSHLVYEKSVVLGFHALTGMGASARLMSYRTRLMEKGYQVFCLVLLPEPRWPLRITSPTFCVVLENKQTPFPLLASQMNASA